MTTVDVAPPEFPIPDTFDRPDLLSVRRTNGAIRVRPAVDGDVGFLWRLLAEDEVSYRWIFRGRQPTPETVRSNLGRADVIPHIVERVSDGKPIGYTVAYDVSHRNGHTHIGTVIDPEHIGSGVGISATILFVDYIFAVFPMRKLYLRSIEYSFAHYRDLVRRDYARIEGVLRDYEYFGGRYWDVYVVALDRDRFMALRDRTRKHR